MAGAILLPVSVPSRRRLVELAGQAVLLLAPLALWLTYLAALGLPGDPTGARNFAAPLSAYAAKWVSTVAALQVDRLDRWAWHGLLVLISLTTQAVVLAARRNW